MADIFLPGRAVTQFGTFQPGINLNVPDTVAGFLALNHGAVTYTPGALPPRVLSAQEYAAFKGVVSGAEISADDIGSAWAFAPPLLSFSAVLASGTATTVLLEVRNDAGTVATAATITADTVGQVLRQAFLMRQQSEYRFRRSSGTGVVTINI